MLVGLRFTEDGYTGYNYPASGYMDVGGQQPGKLSAFKVGRVYGWPDPGTWGQRARGLGASVLELGNEPNLRVEHAFASRREYMIYAAQCAANANGVATCSAGMSPSNDPGATQGGAFLDWYAEADAIPNVEHTGAHVYGRTLDELVTLTESILAVTTKPLLITEINFGPAKDFYIDRDVWARAALRPYLLDYVRHQLRIKTVLYFAEHWNADFPIGTPVDARGTAILSVLAEAGNLPVNYNIGAGFQKVVRDLGWTPLENEIYHFENDPTRKASMAVFDQGRATWSPQDNETVAVAKNGTIYSDGGNSPIDSGRMAQVWPRVD